MNGGLRYDLGRVAQWAVPLTMLSMAMEVVLLATSAQALWFVSQVEAGVLEGDALTLAADRVDQYALIAGIGYLAVVITAYIANGIWIYRASWNARQLQPFAGRITPGWAIGWFFVPFLSLWKPYLAIKETWAASLRAAEVPVWMGWWWAAWIVANVLGQISFRMSKSVTTMDDLRMVAWIDVVSALTGLCAGYLFLRIIRAISSAQMVRRPEEAFE